MAGWVGTGTEVGMSNMRDKDRRGWSHVGSNSRVRGGDTDDNRSNRLPGAQLLVGPNRYWTVFRGRP